MDTPGGVSEPSRPRQSLERTARGATDLVPPSGRWWGFIEDPDDRKFAALSAAAKVPLVTTAN
jgi:hypothetical protein